MSLYYKKLVLTTLKMGDGLNELAHPSFQAPQSLRCLHRQSIDEGEGSYQKLDNKPNNSDCYTYYLKKKILSFINTTF